MLYDGDILEERSFALSNRFRNTSAAAIIIVAGNGVRIRNVKILGAQNWDPHWNKLQEKARLVPGVFGTTVGIRIQNVRDVSLDHIAIEGLPRAAVSAFGVNGGYFGDIQIRHCYHGINFLPKKPSHRIQIERVSARDLWGPPPHVGDAAGKAGHPSLNRTGGWIGGDGLALNSLRDSVVADCVAKGEMFAGFKMTNPRSVEARGLQGPNLVIQGTADLEWKIHKRPAENIWIHDCVFHKGLAHGSAVNDGNCIQVAWNVEGLLIENCLLNGAGKRGHAIQFSGNCHGRVVGCTIRGFNGAWSGHRAHAIDLAKGSSVNADFEQVNEFINQKRIRSDRNPRPS